MEIKGKIQGITRNKEKTFKAEKDHIEKVLSKGFLTNKDFWKHFGPALSEKYSNTDIDIVLKEGDKMISNDAKIAEIFNKQYINIIENTTGTAPVLGVIQILFTNLTEFL